MGEFTLHDGDHLFRVLNLMERLAPKKITDRLSVPELLLLILSAFFHDIGMAPSEREVRGWLGIWENQKPSEEELALSSAFSRFVKGRPDKKTELDRLIEEGQTEKATLVRQYLVSEYIRITHAARARDIIGSEWAGKIKYRD